MRFPILSISISILSYSVSAQSVTQKLQKAFTAFEKDTQLTHAISSLYVIDAQTGQVVFDKNSQIGLAPASTQKIITSVSAFELLGKDYRYKTELGYVGTIQNKKLDGSLVLKGNGDPTLGSWRWEATKEEKVIGRFLNAIAYNKINDISNSISIYNTHWESLKWPDGWIVQDIGNYYGAGAFSLNWRENQFDILLNSGDNVGDAVTIAGYKPKLFLSSYISQVKTAEKGTGDNAYIYTEPRIITGTIPKQEKNFVISGAMLHPPYELVYRLSDTLMGKEIDHNKPGMGKDNYKIEDMRVIHTEYSPSLDSIIYWFNKRSINLYGEALIKTFAYEKQGYGSTDSGVSIVKKFWEEKKLDKNELNIVDGSGLSPLNRVTTHAQVEILKYAKNKDWFPYFYTSLPEYNGMKIKSGTIRNVKGFCGYHTAKNGKVYIFSFLVNNYNGSASGLVNKMYKVLDLLK